MAGEKLIEYWHKAIDYIEKRKNRGEPELPTGIKFIDDLTDGLHKGELWCISAKTGFGKTALAMQIARNISDKPDKAVLFISLEMQGEELVGRMFCEMMEIDYNEFRRGEQSADYEGKERAFRNYIKGINFEIVEYGYNFAEIEKILREYYTSDKKPDVVFIDFVQLIEWQTFKDERVALTEYTRKLAELAKREHLAIVMVSQIRRMPSGSDYNKPPDVIDLKGSGALEQLSHVVIIIYRTIEKFSNAEETKHFIKVVKNRYGETGECEFRFIGKHYKFKESYYA